MILVHVRAIQLSNKQFPIKVFYFMDYTVRS